MEDLYTLWKKIKHTYKQKFTGNLYECYFEMGKLTNDSNKDLTLEFMLKYENYLICPFGVNPDSISKLVIDR
jgi:hypothetical protein